MLGFMYLKRWYFRLDYHSSVVIFHFQGEEYFGEFVLLGLLATLLMFVSVIFRIENSWKTVSLYSVVWLCMPCISFLFTELVLHEGFPTLNFTVSLNNILIYLLVYVLFLTVSNSMGFSAVFSFFFFSFFAVINYYVYSFRGKPVFPQDLCSIKTAAAVAGGYKWHLTGAVILITAFAAAFGVFWLKCKVKLPRKFRYFSFSFFIILSLYVGEGIIRNNICDVQLSMWNPMSTCAEKGYMLPFATSVKYLFPEKPADYDAVDLKKNVSSRYAGDIRDSSSLPQNVIVIMEESWADLSVNGPFSTSCEVMPFYDSTDSVKGKAYVSVFGGNTANSEYEFLTGNSVACLPGGVIAYQMYIKDQMPSLVSFLKNFGYKAVSYHPEDPENYNRNQVYSFLGFDESYWEDSFPDNEYVRGLVSDSSDFRHLIQLYENKDTDRLFVFNVTAQNHAGYETGMEKTVTLDSAVSCASAEEYLSLVRLTDGAIKELIDYFSSVDEKTVILIFGDHQPSINTDFYEAVRPTEVSSGYDSKYITCYMLWANYTLPPEVTSADISVNYLPLVLSKAMGLTPGGYLAFLDDLYSEYPVVSAVGCIDARGSYFPPESAEEYSEKLRLYHTLQYNYIFDSKNMPEYFFWQ